MNAVSKIFLFALLTGYPIFSQQVTFQDSLLDKMTGEWIIKGTIARKETTHDVSINWVLGHQYIQIHEVSREKNASSQPEYEAIVYIGWDAASNSYTCLWLDVTGSGGLMGDAVAHAKRDGDSLPFFFNISGSLFHTTFVFDKNRDTWQWIMDNEENGKLKPFARVVLTHNKR